MKTRQLLSNSAIATIMGRRQECVNVLEHARSVLESAQKLSPFAGFDFLMKFGPRMNQLSVAIEAMDDVLNAENEIQLLVNTLIMSNELDVLDELLAASEDCRPPMNAAMKAASPKGGWAPNRNGSGEPVPAAPPGRGQP